MATITNLERAIDPPALNREGNIVSGTELWWLNTSSKASPVEAEALLSALNSGNPYGWMVPGVDTHPDNGGIYATSFSVERMSKWTVKFQVTVNLTNEINEINQNRRAIDAEAIYSYTNVDTLIEVDIDPIVNRAIAASNGEAYFPKVQRKGVDKRIVITRNERKYDPRRAIQYEVKLNKTEMQIQGRSYPARSLLLESWTGDLAIDNDGSEYFVVKYSLLYDQGGHFITLIDAASGRDKVGRYPQVNGYGNKPFKLGRDEAGDGEYMRRADQENPTLFYTRSFYVHEEIDMRFLRL